MLYFILNTCETHEKIKLVASLAKNVLHSYCIVLRTSVLSVSVYWCATLPIPSQTAVFCATSSTNDEGIVKKVCQLIIVQCILLG